MQKIKIKYKGKAQEVELRRSILLRLEAQGITLATFQEAPIKATATLAKLLLGTDDSLEDVYDNADMGDVQKAIEALFSPANFAPARK